MKLKDRFYRFIGYLGAVISLLAATFIWRRLETRKAKRAEYVGAATTFQLRPGVEDQILVQDPYTGTVHNVELPEGVKARDVKKVGMISGGTYAVSIDHIIPDRSGGLTPRGDSGMDL